MKESIIYEEISIENRECIEEDGKEEKKKKVKIGRGGGVALYFCHHCKRKKLRYLTSVS